MKCARLFALLALLILVLSSCNVQISTSGAATPTSGTESTEPHWGTQTKTSGCVAQNALPDSACTPGAIIATATKDQICRSGYASSVRNVPTSEKDQVYAEYGVSHHSPG